MFYLRTEHIVDLTCLVIPGGGGGGGPQHAEEDGEQDQAVVETEYYREGEHLHSTVNYELQADI